jgi:hypothetical protein
VKRECAAKLHQNSKKLRFFYPPAKVADEKAANHNIHYPKQRFKIVASGGRFIFSVRQSFFGLKNPVAKAQAGFFRGAFRAHV